jgi:hypothetical protein
MSKNKSKKKHNRHINPHKLGENELREKINEHLAKHQINDAYSMAKVLLERFESAATIALFQSVLNKKISNLESAGNTSEAAHLITEAKKRFSSSFFSEADEYVKLQALDDERLVDHFSAKESVPDLFRLRLADILYFSDAKNRQFINRHPEYKDVFYVKEAFRNGYHPVDTPQLLAGIKATSPYRPWILLHKAIQAFQEGDGATLELVVKKLPDHSFPGFLTSRLHRCQRYLDGVESEPGKISPDDLELFRIVCGDHGIVAFMLSGLMHSQRVNPVSGLLSGLRWFEKNRPDWYPDVLTLCLKNELHKRANRYEDSAAFFSLVEKLTLPEIVALNKTHFSLKTGGFDVYDAYQREKIVDSILNSQQIQRLQLFDASRIKAELLLYYARSLKPPKKHSDSLLSGMLPRYVHAEPEKSPVPVLEKALEFSDHNPEIFSLLINYYLDVKEKTSIVNKVVDRMLKTFPANPEAYELAGRIALKNKTYKKAIGLFDTVKELMPLNKEINQTIFDCYAGIIEKRDHKSAHLIDKDLESAAMYLEGSKPEASIPYRLLEVKTLLKKHALSIIRSDELKRIIGDLLTTIGENGQAILKLSLLLFESVGKDNKLTPIFELTWNRIVSDVTAKTFLVFQHYALSAEEYPSREFSERFARLTVQFLKREKAEKTLAAEQHLEMISLVLKQRWYKTFIGLVCLARCCYRDNKVFSLLECLIMLKANRQRISGFLHDPDLIGWMLTPPGKQLVAELSMLSETFEELDYLIAGCLQTDPGKIIEGVDNMEYELPGDFDNFSANLLEDVNNMDFLPLPEVKKIFGTPIRVKNQRYSGRSIADGLFDLDPWAFSGSSRKAERKRQAEQKKREEEREQEHKARQERAEKKKRSGEEIAGKNDQIDIFDLLGNTEILP